jgi:hypothetical protein
MHPIRDTNRNAAIILGNAVGVQLSGPAAR